MSREWKPGDVAMVGNRYDNGDWQFGVCVQGGPLPEAVWQLQSGGRVWGSVHQVRPLVVIDPESAEDAGRLVRLYLTEYDGQGSVPQREEIACMQAALRTFADPPPQIEEPTEFGARVRDARGVNWVRTYQPGCGEKPWCTGNHHGTWADIDAVEILSEGVPS